MYDVVRVESSNEISKVSDVPLVWSNDWSVDDIDNDVSVPIYFVNKNHWEIIEMSMKGIIQILKNSSSNRKISISSTPKYPIFLSVDFLPTSNINYL